MSDGMMPWMTQDVVNEPNYPRYWFGAVDKSQNPATVVFKDGFLAPFLESDSRVFLDPDFGPDNVTQTKYNTFTTSYAYNSTLGPGTSLKYDANYNVVGVWPPGYTIQTGDDPSGTYPVGTIIPPVSRSFGSVQHTARTIVFADSAMGLDPTWSKTGLTENWYLTPPNPGAANYVAPTVHYRHTGQIANVSFADGHVEQVRYIKPPATLWTSYGTQPPAATGNSVDGITWFDQQKLSFFGFDNSAYNPSGDPSASK